MVRYSASAGYVEVPAALYCSRPEMRHFVVAEIVRLRVELPASLRILTNPATSQSRPRAGLSICRVNSLPRRCRCRAGWQASVPPGTGIGRCNGSGPTSRLCGEADRCRPPLASCLCESPAGWSRGRGHRQPSRTYRRHKNSHHPSAPDEWNGRAVRDADSSSASCKQPDHRPDSCGSAKLTPSSNESSRTGDRQRDGNLPEARLF